MWPPTVQVIWSQHLWWKTFHCNAKSWRNNSVKWVTSQIHLYKNAEQKPSSLTKIRVANPRTLLHSTYSPFHWKSTGLGCKSESEVTQSCPTLRNPVDCSPPGFSVHRIFQARMLEGAAVPSLSGSFWVGIESASPALEGRFLTTEPPGLPRSP